MSAPLALDLTRLFVSILRGRPRGIERVDLDFVEAALADDRRLIFGIIAYPWGPRVLERQTVQRLVQSVRLIWAEDQPLHLDGAYQSVHRWLTGLPHKARLPGRMRRLPRDIAQVIARTGLRRGRRIQVLPERTIYLNAGQVGFAVDRATNWLQERSDIRVVSFLHDLLPILSPEWFESKGDDYFAKLLGRMLDRSETIVVSTEVCGQQLKNYCLRNDRPIPRIEVQPLVPSPALAYREPWDRALAKVPYFVMCGTIESRKNHLLPLLLWRQSLAGGKAMPRLIVAGERGWGAAEARDLLDRSEVLKSHVLEVAGLSSPALMHLIAHSRGLLAPSFAEGFGLPVIEAMTLGTPVIASQIPVFEETTSGKATLLDNLDGPSWLGTITRLGSLEPDAMRIKNRSYTPISREVLARVWEMLESA